MKKYKGMENTAKLIINKIKPGNLMERDEFDFN